MEVVDEGDLLWAEDADAEAVARGLPLASRFRLREAITPVQRSFLHLHGYLVFDQVAAPNEVEDLRGALGRVQQDVIAQGRRTVFGVPVWLGWDPDGAQVLQRLAFTSTFAPELAAFVRDPRFEPIRTLIRADARLGDREKDGVVFNRYLNAPGSVRTGVGWHTDGLRDVFYGRLPRAQLNVGLHLSRIRAEDGGLRILPGTHRQGVWATLFRKAYFVSQSSDRNEVVVETEPGDVTVHDGRLWHRVAPSQRTGWESERISLYVPYVTDAFAPKDESASPTLYHRVFDMVMQLRRWWARP